MTTTTLIGTLSFNNKANRAKVYTRLRDFSVLSQTVKVSRGNHHLRVHVPTGKTWAELVQLLASEGFAGWLDLGAEIQ